jgi:hypothetical protein
MPTEKDRYVGWDRERLIAARENLQAKRNKIAGSRDSYGHGVHLYEIQKELDRIAEAHPDAPRREP